MSCQVGPREDNGVHAPHRVRLAARWGAMSIDPLRRARPFDLWSLVPPSLQAVLPNVTWDRSRLRSLALPVREVPLAELRWQLDLPWWRDGDRYFAVSPNEVRQAPDRYAVQWRRVLDADLDVPIDLLARDRLVVLDGVHRLLKADVLGMRAITARVLDAARLHEIVS
jgi:hypothetical protein